MSKGFFLKYPITVCDYDLPYYRNINKPLNKVIFSVSGGIGDRIVMEPLIRYIVNNYPEFEYEIVSQNPELYSHIANAKKLSPNDDYDYESGVVIANMLNSGGLTQQFLNSNNINHLDYIHLTAIGATLPNAESKLIRLPQLAIVDEVKKKFGLEGRYRIVHFSDTEPNRSMPDEFFNKFNNLIKGSDNTYVLIGSTIHNNAVKSEEGLFFDNVVNLLNKTTLNEAIALILGAEKVVTNDSFPLHAAASVGCAAEIIYCSFMKGNEYLGHYRVNDNGNIEFGWREFNIVKAPLVNQYFHPIDRFYGNTILLTDEQKMELIDFEFLGELLYDSNKKQ